MSLAASVQELCEWTGGRLRRGAPDTTFEGTKIDSREVGSLDLFVAIVGPNHDAHRFVDDVLAAGAAGVLVQSDRGGEERPKGNGFIVEVEDTTRALADLARGHRQSFEGPLIGITGSNGKTTTKELCTDILKEIGSPLSTRGNLNNNFGVPLTLLRREAGNTHAVIEMGMNHRGEIAVLAEIAQPTIGVLTNVGTAHIEFLGSRETIALEKGDLLAAIPATGTAVVGRDDPLAFAQSERCEARVLSFGRDPKADLRASAVRFLSEGAYSFALETPFGRGEIKVSGLAETIVENALAAAGGAFAAGARFEEVAAGLENHAGVPGRMQPRRFPNDVLIIDDTYNANPQSMRNALETLARLEISGRKFAVLGQMGELGETAADAHREIGDLAGSIDLDGVFVLSPGADLIAEGALAAGADADRVHALSSHTAMAQALGKQLAKGDCVLVKGSRAAHMEDVIESIDGGSH